VRGAQVSGVGPVLTVRRAIAMMGLDGVRRAALALRAWPGPLAEAAADELNKLMARVKRAGRIAIAIRPAGYDAEVVYLITMLQNLGRLVVHYHCPEEAQQIQRLMAAVPPERAGEPPQAGMSEEAAAFSVLGVDIESIGLAIAKRWGVEEGAVPAIRRLPAGTVLHGSQTDDDMLRASASCANELADLQLLPAQQQGQALNKIAQRYGRVLNVTPKDLQNAMQTASTTSTSGMLRASSGNAMYSSSDESDQAEVVA
jgi:eukaryotic-like serine/threonine-protein kinase